MELPVIAALTGAIVGFVLGQINRLFDRAREGRAARSDAAELAIAWAFRISFAPDEMWSKTLTDWTGEVGPMLARFSSLRAKGSQYVVGLVAKELGGLIDNRKDGVAVEELMARAIRLRNELTKWVDDSNHVHSIAKAAA